MDFRPRQSDVYVSLEPHADIIGNSEELEKRAGCHVVSSPVHARPMFRPPADTHGRLQFY